MIQRAFEKVFDHFSPYDCWGDIIASDSIPSLKLTFLLHSISAVYIMISSRTSIRFVKFDPYAQAHNE